MWRHVARRCLPDPVHPGLALLPRSKSRAALVSAAESPEHSILPAPAMKEGEGENPAPLGVGVDLQMRRNRRRSCRDIRGAWVGPVGNVLFLSSACEQ